MKHTKQITLSLIALLFITASLFALNNQNIKPQWYIKEYAVKSNDIQTNQYVACNEMSSSNIS